MKRKITKVGLASLMITIPSKWAKEKHIKAGDEVEVSIEGDMLAISTKQRHEKKSIEFDAKKFDEFNKNFINYFYRAGYDEVIIHYKSMSDLEAIEKRLTEMLGFIIVNKGENSCTIKSVATEDVGEFEATFRRLFMAALDFADSIYNAISKKEIGRLEHIRSIESTTNMLSEFLMRTLQKKGYKDHSKAFFLYSIARELEQLSDRYKYMSDYIFGNKRLKISKEFIGLLSEVNQYFRDYYETFYKFNYEDASILNKKRYLLIRKIQSQFEKEDNLAHQYLAEIVQRIYELIGPLYNLTLVISSPDMPWENNP